MQSTDVRVLGGYVVAPTATTLRSIDSDAERLSAAAAAVATLERLIDTINTVVDDSAIAARASGMKWASIAGRTGIGYTTLAKRIEARKAVLSNTRANAAHRLLALKQSA